MWNLKTTTELVTVGALDMIKKKIDRQINFILDHSNQC